MKALQVMVRLAKQAVDQEQRRLQEINRAIASLEHRIDAQQRQAEQEMARPLDPLGAGLLLQPYLQASRQRLAAAGRSLEELEEMRRAQLDRVTERRVEQKRLEKLVELRARRALEEAARVERLKLDELVTTRWRRNPPG
jgi:flagellar export protein FliJ